ncbi:MAG: molybdenum cofactor biosynthesis protein [Terriglobales bacterium]
MQVRVRLFGPLAARLNRREEILDLPVGATAGDVFRHYAADDPGLGTLGRDVQLAVNAEFTTAETPLAEDDEVALLPPMSGGSDGGVEGAGPGTDAGPTVALVRGPIALAPLRAAVAAPGHGGVVVFEGVTRADPIEGQAVAYLDYEAYEPMALRQMAALAAEARRRYALGAIAMAHRLGRVPVGETSVVIAVGAAHRGPAFEACAWAIAELKRTVPIWKRECTAHGGRWSPGTPFGPCT